MNVAGYSLPEIDRAVTAELLNMANTALSRARENGQLTDGTANKLALLSIDRIYNLDGGFSMPTDLRIWRLKVLARLRAQLPAYFPGADSTQFDGHLNEAVSLGPVDGFRTFVTALGDEAVTTLAPNVAGLQWLAKNVWWIAPAAAAVYLAPSIIQTVKAIK